MRRETIRKPANPNKPYYTPVGYRVCPCCGEPYNKGEITWHTVERKKLGEFYKKFLDSETARVCHNCFKSI